MACDLESGFRTRLTTTWTWDDRLEQINQQTHMLNVTVATGCHVDAIITHSPRKPRVRLSYEAINDRKKTR